jgi:septum formation protein
MMADVPSATGAPPQLTLASQSPRRRQLLDQVGAAYRVLPVDVDETPAAEAVPAEEVVRFARQKAEAGAAASGDADRVPVLGSDTALAFRGRLLGKPRDAEQARAWLGELSGQGHEVLSAVAVCDGRRTETALNRTRVTFAPLDGAAIDAYIATGEPLDKAGAYAIQGRGALFVREIHGSYSAVMGLPLYETGQLLAAFGVALPGVPATEEGS